MKNRTICFLTVLITYLAECAITFGTVAILMYMRADVLFAIIDAGVIGIIFSIAGVKLAKQPKCVWISFSLTVLSAWFTAILLGNLLGTVMTSVVGMTEVVNIISLILGFPGFQYGMMLGEYYTVSSVLLCAVIYILSGFVPVIVTAISAMRKK